MKKRMVQRATYGKTNEVPWINLKSKIDEFGVEKVINTEVVVFDNDSVAYTVQIHLKPAKKGGTKA